MLTFTYDVTLVAAALCISMIAAFTGLTLTSGLSALSHVKRKVFVSMAALALGGGIWSTHFVAMLALELPVDIGYDPLLTLASAMFAILLVGMALLLMHFGKRTLQNIIVAGLLVGAGILSMHYVGMLGIRGCIPQFATAGKMLSGLAAAIMGIAAIWISYARRTQGSVLTGTIVFGLSVVITHFIAMYWTGFARLPAGVAIEPSIHNSQLAMIVTLAAFVICGAFLLSASTFALQAAGPGGTQTPPGVAFADMPFEAAAASAIRSEADAIAGPGGAVSAFPPGTNTASAQANLQVPFERENKIYFVKCDEIAAVRAEGHYTLLYARGKKLFCPWSITKSVANLPAPMFFQTHRSYLVNTARITAFERRKDTGVCILRDEAIDSVPVSRSKVGALRDLLDL
ncbi:MHYT domain-containing protein [Anderseniella sp. Alg231-50]|uniref:MHYT domain-containing protein n=1 Tax=Anderseniella sp. Alg231-50 TaxID=1922226 RepID=UPI000D55F65D